MSKYPKVTRDDLIIYEPKQSVKNVIGNRYGRFTVISFAGKKISKTTISLYYNCKCDCGNEVIVSSGHLKGGKTKSCGCISIEHPNRTVHGYAPLKGKREKIYHAWHSMHARCSERAKGKDKTRKYGEKGIVVCEGWSGKNGFLNFKEQMFPPTDKSVDRIDNDLHYSCGKCDQCKSNGWQFNCRWANDNIQSNNRSDFNRYIIVDGIRMNHRAADRYLGYPIKTINGRINRGWTDEQAISIFPKMGNRKPNIKK